MVCLAKVSIDAHGLAGGHGHLVLCIAWGSADVAVCKMMQWVGYANLHSAQAEGWCEEAAIAICALPDANAICTTTSTERA